MPEIFIEIQSKICIPFIQRSYICISLLAKFLRLYNFQCSESYKRPKFYCCQKFFISLHFCKTTRMQITIIISTHMFCQNWSLKKQDMWGNKFTNVNTYSMYSTLDFWSVFQIIFANTLLINFLQAVHSFFYLYTEKDYWYTIYGKN